MNYKAIANKLRELADLFDGNEAPTTRRKPQGNLISISGVVLSEYRTAKVLQYFIDAINLDKQNPIKCVIFHNKGDFNYQKGDEVCFKGTFQTNTFRGKTSEDFIVEEDLSGATPKSATLESKDNSNELLADPTDDEIPF